MQPGDMAYSNAIFVNMPVSTTTITHEIMHVILNAVHDGPNTLWGYYNSSPPWCIWYTSIFGQQQGILERKRILDTMRTRLLKSKFCK
jgi:hypothetical protein